MSKQYLNLRALCFKLRAPLLLLIFCQHAHVSSAHAEFSTYLWESHWMPQSTLWIRPDLTWHFSNANYDSQNVVYSPTGSPNYLRGDLSVLARWSPLSSFTFFGRANWTSVFLTLNGQSASAFGLGDQTVGAVYRAVRTDRVAFDVQAQVDIPLYSNTSNASAGLPFLGNTVMDITAGGFLEWAANSSGSSEVFINLGTGFTYRTNGYSAGLPWNIGITYRPPRRSLGFEITWMGYLSLSPVSFPPQSVTSCITNPVLGTGGLCWAGSPSPSFGRPQVQVNFALSKAVMGRAFGAMTVYGASAPRDIQVGAGLQWTLSKSTSPDEEILDRAEERQREKDRFPEPQAKSIGGTVSYGAEGRVIRANDRMHLVQINIGSEKGIRIGDTVDIFSVGRDGGARETIARGRVISVKLNESAVRVGEYFKEVWIEEGFLVKKPLSGGNTP